MRRTYVAPVLEQQAAAASDGDMTEPLNTKPRIVAIGVGGAGGNAVNNMIAAGLSGVKFVVANTDVQALAASRTEHRIQLGHHLTEGLGAGSKPEVGEAAAEEAINEIATHIADAHMLFIAAGMGGGTGTGAAYVIARKAREFGILTVAVVTKPFQFEGIQRMRNAEAGIAALMPYVDTLLVIPNENLFRVVSDKTTFAEAFVVADQVLYSGIACLVDLIVKEGLINLDLADVSTILRGMGSAMIGMGEASDEQRAIVAAEEAIVNPLLDNVTLKGAKSLLLSIAGGRDLTLWEVDEAASRVRQEVDADANIIVGAILDEGLEDKLRVAIVASGMPGATRSSLHVEPDQPIWTPRAQPDSANVVAPSAYGRRLSDAIGERGRKPAKPRGRGRNGAGIVPNARDGPDGVAGEVVATPRPKRGKRSPASEWGPQMADAAQSNGRPARGQPLAIEGPPVLEPAPPELGWPEQWAGGATEQALSTSGHHRAAEPLEAVADGREPAPRKPTLFGRLFGRGARRDV
jgi:cell division protein FtsZ